MTGCNKRIYRGSSCNNFEVGDARITIRQCDQTVGSFTTDQCADQTLDIPCNKPNWSELPFCDDCWEWCEPLDDGRCIDCPDDTRVEPTPEPEIEPTPEPKPMQKYLLKFWSTSCGICGRMKHYDWKIAEELELGFISVQRGTEDWDQYEYVLDQLFPDDDYVGYPTYVVAAGNDPGGLIAIGHAGGGAEKGKFRQNVKKVLEGTRDVEAEETEPLRDLRAAVELKLTKAGSCDAKGRDTITATWKNQSIFSTPLRLKVKHNNTIKQGSELEFTSGNYVKDLGENWMRFTGKSVSWKAEPGTWFVEILPTEPDTTNNGSLPPCNGNELAGPKSNSNKAKSLLMINYDRDGNIRNIPVADIGQVTFSCKLSDSADATYKQMWSGKNNLSQEMIPNGKVEFVLVDKASGSIDVECQQACDKDFTLQLTCPPKGDADTNFTITADADGVANSNVKFVWWEGAAESGTKIKEGKGETSLTGKYPKCGRTQKYACQAIFNEAPCDITRTANCQVEAKECPDGTPEPTPSPDCTKTLTAKMTCIADGSADKAGSNVMYQAEADGVANANAHFIWYENDAEKAKGDGLTNYQTKYPAAGTCVEVKVRISFKDDKCDLVDRKTCKLCTLAAGDPCEGVSCDSNKCEHCVNGKCVSKCLEGLVCDGNGNCVDPNPVDPCEGVSCNANQCLECRNGRCVSKCTGGKVCDGNGNCVDPSPGDPCYGVTCNENNCQHCVDGKCVSKCLEGLVCDGNGNCVDPGPGDPCDGVVCDGNKCEECRNGICVDKCDDLEGYECDGNGNCVPIDPCKDVVCPECQECVDGNCVGICVEGELCEGGVCVPDPCYQVDCPDCYECRDGDCCALCGDGEICKDGKCVPYVPCEACDGNGGWVLNWECVAKKLKPFLDQIESQCD